MSEKEQNGALEVQFASRYPRVLELGAYRRLYNTLPVKNGASSSSGTEAEEIEQPSGVAVDGPILYLNVCFGIHPCLCTIMNQHLRSSNPFHKYHVCPLHMATIATRCLGLKGQEMQQLLLHFLLHR